MTLRIYATAATFLLAFTISGCTSSGEELDSEFTPEPSTQSQQTSAPDDGVPQESASPEPALSEDDSLTKAITEEEFRAALQEVESSYDDFDEKTVYVSNRSFDYVENPPGQWSAFGMQLNIPDDGEIKLGLLISFAADDWIFWEYMDVRAGGEAYRLLEENDFDKITDVRGGRVFESGLDDLDLSQRDILWKIVMDEASKLRLRGGEGVFERSFTVAERDEMRTFLTLAAGVEKGFTD